MQNEASMNESKYSEQFYAQGEDGKDYQIEIELEDGPNAEDPEKITVVLNGERKTVDVPKGGTDDHYKKAIAAGLEEHGKYKLMEGKIPDMNEGKYPEFVKIESEDDYKNYVVPTLGDILKKGYQFSDLENAWWEIAPEEEDKIQPKARLKSMRQIVNSEFEPKFIYVCSDTLNTESAGAYISEMGAEPSDYGVKEDDLYGSKTSSKGQSMKITVKEMKCGEAISPKLQDRLKFKEFAQFFNELPFFGQTIGDPLDTVRKEGLGYGVGNGSKEEQEEAAKDILSDFDDYVSWTTDQDTDGSWYIKMTFKPELWALPIEELKKVFGLLDDAFGPWS